MNEAIVDLALIACAWLGLEVLLYWLVAQRHWPGVAVILPLDYYTGNVGVLLALSEVTENVEIALAVAAAANVAMMAMLQRRYGLKLSVEAVIALFVGLAVLLVPLWWEPHWDRHVALHATGDPTPYYALLRYGNAAFVAGFGLLLYLRRDELARQLGAADEEG